MASYCIYTMRRVLHPSSACFLPPTSIVKRWEHVGSSRDSISDTITTKGSSSNETDGPKGKKANKSKDSRPVNAWVPDPETGYYRPIDEATEAQENAMKRNK